MAIPYERLEALVTLVNKYSEMQIELKELAAKIRRSNYKTAPVKHLLTLISMIEDSTLGYELEEVRIVEMLKFKQSKKRAAYLNKVAKKNSNPDNINLTQVNKNINNKSKIVQDLDDSDPNDEAF